jgi:tRNA threonylcarbamoyladenosine biosynthesis protein TsaE
VKVQTRTAEQTEGLGRWLAGARPGDPGALAVLWLTGDLGAGKTTFARGFLGGLGVTGPVRSPTYTLLELHELPSQTVLHVDLYRLRDPSELEALGLRDWARPGCLWLIEWPDRAPSRLPPADLTVTFTAAVESHVIDLQPHSPLGKEWVARCDVVAQR